jgi:hypothetical protein
MANGAWHVLLCFVTCLMFGVEWSVTVLVRCEGQVVVTAPVTDGECKSCETRTHGLFVGPHAALFSSCSCMYP